jgi:hypothetical protein
MLRSTGMSNIMCIGVTVPMSAIHQLVDVFTLYERKR